MTAPLPDSKISQFDPKTAFSRSLGWFTESDLEALSRAHVGIIGMGGVGGQYAEILARLGIGRFTFCDPDTFSIENTNRQNECKVSNYGRNKAEVISELIKDINPAAQVSVMPGEMRLDQVDSFCKSIDIYLDALDFFVIDLRLAIFRKMRELEKPAVTIAPIGMGAAFVMFTKDSMSFDDYFGLHLSSDPIERSLRFMAGLAPSFQHRTYIRERDRLDFGKRKAPSLPVGVYACATVMATTVAKIVLGRDGLQVAPWSIHYDAYRARIVKKYVFWGHRNPFQRLKLMILRKLLVR